MKPERARYLKKLLEETHERFVHSNEIMNDAITPALEYSRVDDREFAAFVCAVLAYGKVSHIQASVRKVLEPLEKRPVERLLVLNHREMKRMYKNWSHRFNNSNDIVLLLSLLQQIYSQHGSLERFVKPKSSESVHELLERLIAKMATLSPAPFSRFPREGSSFWFFLPRPSMGSACKRLNLFLRWMVGTSEMDLGLWKTYSKANLLIPVDTHVLRQARSLRLTKRKTADWVTAMEITEKLRLLDPTDPTRFDFALCHIGIQKLRLGAADISSL